MHHGACALAFAVLAACGSGNAAEDLAHDLEAMSAVGASRVHALVIDDGEMIAATAGPEAAVGEPALDEYEVGASAEPFVATVVLQLVAEGMLTPETPVLEVLPGAIEGADTPQVTVRDVLQHTSGLTDGDLTPPFTVGSDAQWHYAGANYVIAGMLIESLTGRSWTEEVQSRILEPLQLSHTLVGSRTEPPWSDASGTILTTPVEIHRFLAALLGGELLPAAQLSAMQDATTIDPTDGLGYGLGLTQWHLSCDRQAWGQRSGLSGYRSNAVLSDNGRRGIVLSNATVTNDPDADEAQQAAADDIIQNYLCDA